MYIKNFDKKKIKKNKNQVKKICFTWPSTVTELLTFFIITNATHVAIYIYIHIFGVCLL